MRSRAGSLVFLALLMVAMATPLQAEPPSVPYLLDESAGFSEGCTGLCLCPSILHELTGGFRATPAGSSEGFDLWDFTDIDWRVPQGPRFRGSGLFRIRANDDGLEQQLTLDLSEDGGPVERYDSGIVPVSKSPPAVQITASQGDPTCFLRTFQVNARPAGPITFRFEGTVDSVFDGLGALGGEVVPGDVFRGVFTFDPRTPNSAPPFGEGELGLYHHDRPPAGVRLRLRPLTFATVRRDPDFDVIVNNDFGFVGADEYGFVSRNNLARGLRPSAPIDRLQVDWFASTFTAEPLDSARLPLTPPDLNLLGGGLLTIEGECTLCLGPAAFFRIEGTLTSLTVPSRLRVNELGMSWDGPAEASAYDLVRGDLGALRSSGGNLVGAARECLASQEPGYGVVYDGMPLPGEGFWFAARPLLGDVGTYDSPGLAQLGDRDAGWESQSAGCP